METSSQKNQWNLRVPHHPFHEIQDTWQFAHLTCGKLWWKTGWIILPLSVIAMLPCLASSQDTIALVSIVLCLVQCGVLIGTIWPVERALKHHFYSDGTRKES